MRGFGLSHHVEDQLKEPLVQQREKINRLQYVKQIMETIDWLQYAKQVVAWLVIVGVRGYPYAILPPTPKFGPWAR